MGCGTLFVPIIVACVGFLILQPNGIDTKGLGQVSDKEVEDIVQKKIDEIDWEAQIHKNFNKTVIKAEVLTYLKSINWRDAFRQTTGYK
jgi:hypothetical protein